MDYRTLNCINFENIVQRNILTGGEGGSWTPHSTLSNSTLHPLKLHTPPPHTPPSTPIFFYYHPVSIYATIWTLLFKYSLDPILNDFPEQKSRRFWV